MFSTKKLNKFISFDRLNGILECESGVLLSEILKLRSLKGYFLAITPGTKFITLGGAIASNIHGKITTQKERFQNVIEFKMMVEDGEIITCSREENAEKFWATFGAMGLTGIILLQN